MPFKAPKPNPKRPLQRPLGVIEDHHIQADNTEAERPDAKINEAESRLAENTEAERPKAEDAEAEATGALLAESPRRGNT